MIKTTSNHPILSFPLLKFQHYHSLAIKTNTPSMRVVLLSFTNPLNRLCHLIKVILLMDLSESNSITINYINNYEKNYLS